MACYVQLCCLVGGGGVVDFFILMGKRLELSVFIRGIVTGLYSTIGYGISLMLCDMNRCTVERLYCEICS